MVRVSVALLGVTAFSAFASSAFAPSNSTDFRLQLPNHEHYTLTEPKDLSKLMQDLGPLIASQEEFLAKQKAERKKQRAETPLAEMSRKQLQQYHGEPLEQPTGNELRSLRELQTLSQRLEKESNLVARTNTMQLMLETAHGIENLHRSPIPAVMEVETMPFVFLKYLYHPVGKGETEAANITLTTGETDSSRITPPDSTFWKKPSAIAQADLFRCFGRSEWPDYSEIVWEYAEPKTSFGTNPGFKLKHGDIEMKAKFGEQHSEPFNVRIFHALGYNTEQTDYAPLLKIKYDRRLFREYNLHRDLRMNFRLLGFLPGGYVSMQVRHDPFKVITAAVLKDGSQLSATEFKRRLLRNPKQKHPEEDAANFDPAFEAQIDHLVTCAANVQVRENGVQNLGSWDFGGLGHEDLRELRGVALLGAWLGWVDARFDNTRLKLIGSGDEPKLKHYFTDLGGGAGKRGGFFSWHPEEPDRFDWTFTKPRRAQGPGQMTIPFRMNYRPIDSTPAFEEMTWDDARWMARLIGQLTEEQIVQGLIASGWDSAEVRLLTEKLISRRDKMIQDLELAGEIPPLRPQGVRKKFSYDPKTAGPITTTLPNSQKISAPVTDQKIVKGHLVRSADR